MATNIGIDCFLACVLHRFMHVLIYSSMLIMGHTKIQPADTPDFASERDLSLAALAVFPCAQTATYTPKREL